MQLIILSDSHRNTKAVEAVLNIYLNNAQGVIFLGDCIEDMDKYNHHIINLGKDYYAVSGNCDFSGRAPDEREFVFGGKRFLMFHGHKYGVKMGYDRLIYRAMEAEADICLFGHTHYPECFYQNGILFMNPGSISLPRGIKYPSFGIVNIEKGIAFGDLYIKKDGEFELLNIK